MHNSDILSIYDTKFISNKATLSIVHVTESVVSTDNCMFKYNHGLTMNLNKCQVDIFNSVFSNNQVESALSLWSTIIHIHGSEFKENVDRRSGSGGAIYSFRETLISFSEVCTFADNYAYQGGALYLGWNVQCFLARGATVIIANNTASGEGDGIYLYHSNLTLHSQSILQILENMATENGGGIYASWRSSINLSMKSLNYINQTSNSSIPFYGNWARQGGGLYLES